MAPPKHNRTKEETKEQMLAYIAKRVENRQLYDTYGDPIDKLEMPFAQVKPYRDKIKQSLSMMGTMPFVRCRHRDYRRAKALDLKEGITLEAIIAKRGHHTVDGHCCSLCRCTRVAGSGSRGHWYWPKGFEGRPEVGHYGVGPCFKHGPYYKQNMGGHMVDIYRDRIMGEIKAMQQIGASQDSAGSYMVSLKRNMEEAESRVDMKAALFGITELANETMRKIKDFETNPVTQEEMIAKICGVFGLPDDMLSDEEVKELMDIIYARPLTEMSRGVPVSMCDKTLITLKRDLIKDVLDGAKKVYDAHEDEHITKDDATMMIGRFYGEAEAQFRAQAGEEVWSAFISNLKSIGRTLNAVTQED